MSSVSMARLSAAEAKKLAGKHPQLALTDKEGSVLAILVEGKREATAIATLIDYAQQYFTDHGEAVQQLVNALLPPETLRVSSGVLAQVEQNARAQRALADEFGLLSGKEVAEVTGSRATNVAAAAHRLRRSGRVFAIDVAGDLLFPGFQFDPAGKPYPIVGHVIEELGQVLSGWELALWFVSNNAWLGGVRPVDLLDSVDSDRHALIAAAHALADELQDRPIAPAAPTDSPTRQPSKALRSA